MINRDLKKNSLNKFIANSIYETEKYKVAPVKKKRLTTEDCRVLIEIYNILKLFYAQTKRF